MSWGAVAVAGATIVTGYMSQQQQAKAQREANAANMGMSQQQMGMTQQGIDEQQRQFQLAGKTSEETNRQLLERFGKFKAEGDARMQPYAQSGVAASDERAALLGLQGEQAGKEAQARFTESPGQRFLRERQEKALLRSSAAIGGLGGGNVRTALQEQAFGRAQTDRDNYLNQLGTVAGQGMVADQTSIGMGYGPMVGDTSFVADDEARMTAEKEQARLAAERKAAQEAAAQAAAARRTQTSGVFRRDSGRDRDRNRGSVSDSTTSRESRISGSGGGRKEGYN